MKFQDWPLRLKLALLLLVASVLPLTVAAVLDVRDSRNYLIASIEQLLGARAEQVVNDLDASHMNYQGQSARVSRLPDVIAYCSANAAGRAAITPALMQIFSVGQKTDKYIRSWAVIASDGTVLLSTIPGSIGNNVANRHSFREALAGAQVTSDVYLATSDSQPAVAYLSPVRRADGQVQCVVSVAVHAEAFWSSLKSAAGLAGPGSLAIVLDKAGVRVAHTLAPDAVYHPAAPLAPEVIDGFVADKRFGADTRKLLESVRDVPEFFARATADSPDRGLFRSALLSNGESNYGVARRLKRVSWTVFYMQPESYVSAQLDSATHQKIGIAIVFIAIAGLFGAVIAAGILRTVRELDDATTRLTAGDATVRVANNARDELGRLGANFNSMADRIEAQSWQLRQANIDLESRVRERTGLLKSIVDYLPAAIALKDLQGRYLLVNDRAADVVLTTKVKLLGKTVWDIYPKETADRLRKVDERVVASEESVTEEVLGLDGVRSFLSVKFPVRDDAGKIFAVGTIYLDITDRKAAEARLLSQLERLNLLDTITSAIGGRQDLASIHQVMVSTLEDHMLLDFSCVFTYDPEDNTLTVAHVGAGGEALARELAPPGAPRMPVGTNGLSRCIAGELVYEPDVSEIAHPFAVLIAGRGLRSLTMAPLIAGGNVHGVLAVARSKPHAFSSTDCEFLRQLSGHVALASHQARLNETLRQTNADLRQSQQRVLQQERLSALGQMASGIAHDINNAISPAALYVETLLEREPGMSSQARSHLQIVSRAIDDVASTVARMREFYRNREVQADLLPLDLNTIVNQVIELTHARWSDMPQQRGVHIEVKSELGRGLPDAMGIESEIREALINLIFNAVDAMPQGGVLTLRTGVSADGKRIELDVADTGVGMDEATRRKCLEPFFTTKGERGTGLGLAMVYGIVQRHEALIDIESAPGEGTRVRVGFLARQRHQLAPAGLQPQQRPAPMRLLIVDDDPLLLQSLGDTLRADGHAVTPAMGGRAGIDMFIASVRAGDPFNAVITDLGMPQVDGRTVAISVKMASPDTPVVMLTGWGQRLVADGEAPAEADIVLSKPPKLRELRAALVQVTATQGKP